MTTKDEDGKIEQTTNMIKPNMSPTADMSNDHLPDFTSWHGIEVFLAVGNMLELQKVLDPRAYTTGRNSTWNDLAERECLLARNWCTLAKQWISCNYIAFFEGELTQWQDIWDVSLVSFRKITSFSSRQDSITHFACCVLVNKTIMNSKVKLSINKRMTNAEILRSMRTCFEVDKPLWDQVEQKYNQVISVKGNEYGMFNVSETFQMPFLVWESGTWKIEKLQVPLPPSALMDSSDEEDANSSDDAEGEDADSSDSGQGDNVEPAESSSGGSSCDGQ
jgi:hypothetical protein